MAEGDGYIYNEFKEKVMEGRFNLASGGDTLKLAMHSSSYTPDIDTDTDQSTLGNECSGSGYSAGGETLANQDVTKDTGNDRGVFNADNVTWTSLGTLSPQPAYVVLYNSSDSSDLVIAYWEVTTPTNGGNYTIQWSDSPAAIILLT